MKILFTKSNKIGSHLIRWATGEDISHVAIEFGQVGVVFHAKSTGVDIDSIENFRTSGIEVVHEFVPVISTMDSFQRLLAIEGKPYDWIGFWLLGLKLLTGQPFFQKTKGRYICTDLVLAILGQDTENTNITPGELRTHLLQSRLWKELRK